LAPKDKPTPATQTGESANESRATDTADNDRRRYVEAVIGGRAPRAVSKSLIFGKFGDDLLFIPEPRARFLAQVWRALLKAKTWADLKRLAPPAAYREIRRHNSGARDPDELRADAPFDYYEMTSLADGDYPGFPAQEMLRWMPRDIQLDFGTARSTVMNGELLELDVKNTKAIVQRLKQAGFRCRRNQRLVLRAHGD
jgi:hypothetical protein